MDTGKRRYWVILLVFVIALGSLVFLMFPLKTFTVTGISMEPGLGVGDRLLVNMRHYRSAQPKRGELVIINAPDDPSRIWVKRIIALPGEEIVIKNGQLVINGTPKAWPAPLKEAPAQDFEKKVIPKDAVFLMGDNANNSGDSRYYGPVKVSKLLGKVFYRYWSKDPKRIGKKL